ncbi:MAG: protein kinase, partial [Planctomycetota bacterium]|nr:protein kinase [Planctomycetota bacterium]
MSTTATDRLFGEIAVLKGYLTRDLLGKALNYQQTLAVHQPLGQILVQKQVMSPGQVQEVINEQRRRSGPYQAMPNPQRMPNPHMPPMNGALGAHPAPNNYRHTPTTPRYAPPMPPPGAPPAVMAPQRPTSGPYDRGRMNPTSGSHKSKKNVPPGVDESVIDDEGNVDIIGRTIGGCHVTQKIGQGAMGFIFLASHSNLNRQVVVKILPPKAAMTKKNLERFLREARAAAKLEHPNIVQVLNVDKSPEGLYYIIMQYIDGKDLSKLVKEKGAQTWQEATRIIFEAASGL